MLRLLSATVIASILVFTAAAQNQLSYGQSVSGVITNDAFFEPWTFYANAGDEIAVTMMAINGLEPLVGLLDPAGDLVARSGDGAVDGTVTLRHTIERDGTYTLVATRVGNEQGESSGGYSLTLMLALRDGVRPDSREVSFRCGEFEAVTALRLELGSDLPVPGVPYRISVYSLDGFRALIRLQGEATDFSLCRRGNISTPGDIVFLPGEAPILIEESMLADQFDLTLEEPAVNGTMTLTVGSVDGAPGRYLLVIQGLSVETADARDRIIFQVGPRAAAAPVLAYAVADDNRNSRLDPYVELLLDEIGCDDAGRRSCEDVPSFAGAGIRIINEMTLLGDRFDAGLALPVGVLERGALEVRSFARNTFGAYALFFLGALPPIATDGG